MRNNNNFNFILLVDDDPITNYLTERMLCKLKIADKIRIALNGEQALQIIENECASGRPCPDLILLDINMPVMNGLEFLEEYQNRYYGKCPNSKIVILTTSSDKRDYETLAKYGIEKLINKPINESKFLSMI